MASKNNSPIQVGIGIFVLKNGKLLLSNEHYVDIGLVADWKSGELKVLESEKAEGWDWYDLDKLPKPLFETVKTFLEALNSGKNFFDK